jgi:hypothetical protein
LESPLSIVFLDNSVRFIVGSTQPPGKAEKAVAEEIGVTAEL